ncbi:hypothetical protein SHIRM173S_00550 [Streptomyces hirsutus]
MRVGEQVHGVPGDRREQRGAAGRLLQPPHQCPVVPRDRVRRRGRGAGDLVDAGEREAVRGAAGRRPAVHQAGEVAAQFAEGDRPGAVGVGQRGVGRDESGAGDPGAQHVDGAEPFLGMRGREEIQTDPPGVEPQLVGRRDRTQCHVPVTA